MNRMSNLSLNKENKLKPLHSPIFSDQKSFLGKTIQINENVDALINALPKADKYRLHNQLGRLVSQGLPLYRQKKIFIELFNSTLMLKLVASKSSDVVLQEARLMSQPRPMDIRQSKNDCGIRRGSEFERAVLGAPYTKEIPIESKSVSPEQAVELQIKRLRERVRLQQLANRTDFQWADVVYAAWDTSILYWERELIVLSALYHQIGQTNTMHRSEFGYTSGSNIEKVLHRYALILGYPDPKDRRLQQQFAPDNPYRERYLEAELKSNKKYRYNPEVVVRIDSDLNIHKFYKNGNYEFVDCSDSY